MPTFDPHDVLLVGYAQLFVVSALMLSPLRRVGGAAPAAATRLLLRATGVLATAALTTGAVSLLWDVPWRALVVPGAVVVLASAFAMVRRPDRTVVGQLFGAAFVVAGLGLIVATIDLVADAAGTGPEMLTSAVFVALCLGAVALWSSTVSSTTDVLCRFRSARVPPQADPTYQPFVSLHLAACNEPPDMLIETIKSAEAMDYPSFEVVVIDNNTTDPALWRPVEAYCQGRDRVTYVHVDSWPGFKAGACNLALRHHTDPRAEVIGVIDADDLVVPDYLKEAVPYLADERLGFVQTYEGARGIGASAYRNACVDTYRAFYLTDMAARNERDSVPFVGTMGLFRRQALEQIGGWNEWCICEDTEASLRVLKLGWSSLYLPRCFGRGTVPPTFAGFIAQRYRWCFGGMQILRLHWRSLMPWDRSPDNRLSRAQRHDYLMAGLSWTRDVLMVLFALLLLVTTALVAAGSTFSLQPVSGPDPIVALSLIAVASLSTLWVLRQRGPVSLRRALLFLVVSLASSWTVARACVQGSVRRHGVFVRTPKATGSTAATPRYGRALASTRWEALVAAVFLACIAVLVVQPRVHWWLVAMVSLEAAVFLCAPATALGSVRAARAPAEVGMPGLEPVTSRRRTRGQRRLALEVRR
jgi:cellulose synthase/poly-beta-1,6-N-acetylglucosamine synthase-like glycosyltransferase